MKNIIKIEEYEKEVKIIANKLANGNEFLAEDLMSEMYLAILTSGVNKNKTLRLREAKYRAIDYLRSKAISHSYRGKVKHISLDAMEEVGFQIDTEGKVYPPSDESTLYFDEMQEE